MQVGGGGEAHDHSPLDQLVFRREVVRTYFLKYRREMTIGRPPTRSSGGKPKSLRKSVPDEVWYDGLNHHVVKGPK